MARPHSLLQPWEGSSSRLTRAVGRMQFLAAIGLRSLFPCWLSAGNQSAPRGCLQGYSRLYVHSSNNMGRGLLTRQVALTSPLSHLTDSSQTSLLLRSRGNIWGTPGYSRLLYLKILNRHHICKVPFTRKGHMFSFQELGRGHLWRTFCLPQ